MATKGAVKDFDADAGAVVSAPPQLTLAEFCIRLSKTDRRVELIGAFNHGEIAAGRIKDTESAYAERYAKFVNQPA